MAPEALAPDLYLYFPEMRFIANIIQYAAPISPTAACDVFS